MPHRPVGSVAFLLLALLGAFGCANLIHREPHPSVEVVTVRRDYNNAHALVFAQGVILVDAGLERDAPALDTDLRSAGVAPERIRAVVLTHGHADHAGGAQWFRARYGADIYVGAADRSLLARGANDELCPTDATARRRLERSRAARYAPLVADVEVAQMLDLESSLGIRAKIVPVPGHTPGSLAVVADGVAVVGDLFRGEIVGHDAAVHFYMCDLEDNRRDIAWLLDRGAPRANRFYTGHFGAVSRAEVRALVEDARR